MRTASWFTLLASILVGCTARTTAQAPQSSAEPGVDWSTPKGREEARLDMARTLLDMGRAQEAMTVLAAARQESGSELAVDVLQARAYLGVGMAGEAAALLEPWLRRSPRDAELYRTLGLVRFEQRRLEEAERAFLEAVEIEPDSFDSSNNLGFLLLTAGRPEEALVHLRAALALRPTDRRARNNIGFALAALERDEEALDVFRAADIEPSALANMGLACERRGDPNQARAWYDQALAIDPGQHLALEALQRLDEPETGAAP